jgi:hypothetical protein
VESLLFTIYTVLFTESTYLTSIIPPIPLLFSSPSTQSQPKPALNQEKNKGKRLLPLPPCLPPFSLAIRLVDLHPDLPDHTSAALLLSRVSLAGWTSFIPSKVLPVALVQIAIFMTFMLQPPSRLSYWEFLIWFPPFWFLSAFFFGGLCSLIYDSALLQTK